MTFSGDRPSSIHELAALSPLFLQWLCMGAELLRVGPVHRKRFLEGGRLDLKSAGFPKADAAASHLPHSQAAPCKSGF